MHKVVPGDQSQKALGFDYAIVDETTGLTMGLFREVATAQRAADGLNGREMVATPSAVRYYVFTSYNNQFRECLTLDGCVTALKEALGDQDRPGYSQVIVLRGDRLYLSRSVPRHLLIPGQSPIPLFDAPRELEPDLEGWLGESCPAE